jgi:hypothetical protein
LKAYISQNNFLPWRGFFASIREADAFIILDSRQYTRRDWRNRNFFALEGVVKKVSVPVTYSQSSFTSIDNVQIHDRNFFRAFSDRIERNNPASSSLNFLLALLKGASDFSRLSEANEYLNAGICEFLEIGTPQSRDRSMKLDESDPSTLLADICHQVGAENYICGPNSRNYLNERPFVERGVDVTYLDFSALTIPPSKTQEVSMLSLILENTQLDCMQLTSFRTTTCTS